MDNICNCDCIVLAKGEFPDPMPWFEKGTILNVEVLNFNTPIGVYQVQPMCDHEHHLGPFILGAYAKAGFDNHLENLLELGKHTTIQCVCPKHKYVKINIDFELT